MMSFVRRARKKGWSTHYLEERIALHSSATEAERLFLELGSSVYRRYLELLRREGKEDFDGLMWRAVAAVRGGPPGSCATRAVSEVTSRDCATC
jgi:hypothetical protein